ncbi:hypothetical protein ACFQ0M_00130 [Kitasatospora aburaviensis]
MHEAGEGLGVNAVACVDRVVVAGGDDAAADSAVYDSAAMVVVRGGGSVLVVHVAPNRVAAADAGDASRGDAQPLQIGAGLVGLALHEAVADEFGAGTRDLVGLESGAGEERGRGGGEIAGLRRGVLVVQPSQDGVRGIVGAGDTVTGELLEPTHLDPALVRQEDVGALDQASGDLDEAVLLKLQRQPFGLVLREALPLHEVRHVLSDGRLFGSLLIEPQQGLRQDRVLFETPVAAVQVGSDRYLDRMAVELPLQFPHRPVDGTLVPLDRTHGDSSR